MLPSRFQTRSLLPPLCAVTVGIRGAPPSLPRRLSGPEALCALYCMSLCPSAGEQVWLVGRGVIPPRGDTILSRDDTDTEAGGRVSACEAGDRTGQAEVHEGECIKRRE
ncbi:hypothetical protein INS49_000403 [Diaporthe citri]|uniref:uncharacterized protein n=1 Tax=Diaporthe citri TaxID=83186 RepID=UPI001C82169B|nr:uncharacterized protein INS49_000403 [Diaporthe citri]KAG6366227.1 hypothetical protein INS49_000403 [Diaporthe citri]